MDDDQGSGGNLPNLQVLNLSRRRPMRATLLHMTSLLVTPPALVGGLFAGNLTSTGNRAFSGCTRLTSIALPDGLISIGNRAFF